MRRADPTPDAEAIASAIRDAADPSGLRDAAETVADVLGRGMSDAFVSGAELDLDYGKANVTDGLFAVARSLSRIAKALESRNAP
jgi:hypothetical protein